MMKVPFTKMNGFYLPTVTGVLATPNVYIQVNYEYPMKQPCFQKILSTWDFLSNPSIGEIRLDL